MTDHQICWTIRHTIRPTSGYLSVTVNRWQGASAEPEWAYDHHTPYHDLLLRAYFSHAFPSQPTYGMEWGLNVSGILSPEKAALAQKVMVPLQKKLAKLDSQLGPPASPGQLLARLALVTGITTFCRERPGNAHAWEVTGLVPDAVRWVDGPINAFHAACPQSAA